MSLVINHNLMAMNAARNLSNVYSALSTSTQRLSSGLRVNSAADDAAGLAIRELMRSDISVINQGIRNASDAISMIQTAEGAMSVIDEKLIRMKELAEQAATGTYTTAQREIMNSEYQAMAAEIDRIANATDFNGVKLLDGSLSNGHAGSGMKIHFGTGNSAAEDYYFIKMADMRATQATGLNLLSGGGVDWTSASTIVASNTAAQAFINQIDAAITTLNTRRSDLGAAQNRLEHTVNSLGVAVENLTASESQIRDADIAAEMMRVALDIVGRTLFSVEISTEAAPLAEAVLTALGTGPAPVEGLKQRLAMVRWAPRPEQGEVASGRIGPYAVGLKGSAGRVESFVDRLFGRF